MKRIYLVSILFLLWGGQQSAEAQSGEAIAPAQYRQMLGRGFDVNWWDQNGSNDYNNGYNNGYSNDGYNNGYDNSYDNTYDNTYDGDGYNNGYSNDYSSDYYSSNAIADFRNEGIQHVRIRLSKPYFSQQDFYMLDQQVNQCIRYGVIPIISYSPVYYSRIPAYQFRLQVVNWWRAMADHFRYSPASLSFDLLFEPSNSIFSSYADLNLLYEDCVSAIRLTNPYRIIFISPNYNSDPAYLRYLSIPSRGNGYLMAEWHFYPYSSHRPWNNWQRRSAYERSWVNRRIQLALSWQSRTGIFTWVGGWMPGSYYDGYDYMQDSYTDFMCGALSRAGIPFAIGADRHFYNYRTSSWQSGRERSMRNIFASGRRYNDNNGFQTAGRGEGGFSIGDRHFGDNRGNGFVRQGGNGRSSEGNYQGNNQNGQNGYRIGDSGNRRNGYGNENRNGNNNERDSGIRQSTYTNDNPSGSQASQRQGGGGFSRGNNGGYRNNGSSSQPAVESRQSPVSNQQQPSSGWRNRSNTDNTGNSQPAQVQSPSRQQNGGSSRQGGFSRQGGGQQQQQQPARTQPSQPSRQQSGGTTTQPSKSSPSKSNSGQQQQQQQPSRRGGGGFSRV